MPTGIHHPGSQNSYRAIHGGEGFIELGHPTAQRRRFLNKIHLHPGGGQIKRRLNPGDTTAYYQNTLFSILLRGHNLVLSMQIVTLPD